ncbi:DNA mismatch repair protein MutS [Aliterella atlantica]|uniref:DNA mismatch repair protein MutS n=1 Tax=Aliterella atlantica CENA595 TaxID=1618023 RepID=A0A0D8ZTJ9_9CYAN|nr:DNA mismatch repair protein MutS [Aliterella atlantica]KJH72103.1 DNA mismatch repair protein MutS [Aliterella atlantica CENA595]
MNVPPSASSPDFNQGKPQLHNADYRQLDIKKLSPMMQHYVEIKEQYSHALLLYRVGDFYEVFFQDACTVSEQLELVLTSIQAGKEIGRVPMSGVPHHAIDRYCALLVEKGYAIAICDQVEDAATAAAQNRQVKREVTRVLTPGTLLDEGMLNARRNNFLAAVVIAGEHWGLAYADISTGEFLTTQASSLEQLTQELMRLQPSEVLYPTNVPDLGSLLRPGEKSEHLPSCLPTAFCYALRSQTPFTHAEARQRLLQRFKMRSLEGLGCEHLPLAVRAAGGLLEYLEATQKENPVALQLLRSYTISDYLIVDSQSRRNLEIMQTVRDGTLHGSLLWALDRTCTAMGGRALRRWFLQPLLDIKGIRARQETIAELVEDTALRHDLRQLLRQIYDLERLTGRAGSGSANARDLVALADSLLRLPEIARLVENARSPYLKALQKVPPILEQLGHQIHAHLVESPPLYLTEGGLIRSGINEQLDNLRHAVEQDQLWIANLEVEEKARTGIPTLKVGFNKTFGYYLSISRSKADQVPSDYIRKQTLTNEERYITPDLKEKEARILTARDDLNRLEYEVFSQLRIDVGLQAEVIRNVSRAVAAADVLCGLAEVAVYQGYCRPEMVEGREIEIVDGRHPVVEQSLPAGFFVPNSTWLGWDNANHENDEIKPDLIVLTGPNASGKSCYLRQVGLIQLMAQVGSFVPARMAKLGVCDRIFTRVGAVDDLATGQSTFMVEMNETANILNHATVRSLVLLDEIGRGTATFDGLSIAWAVAEYLAGEIGARTIFATHYHELNELASLLPNVANYQVTVKELTDQIIFLHQVRPGGADRSYGIEAGRLAGLPGVVIARAKQVMGQIEQHSKIAIGLRAGISTKSKA